MRPLTPAVIGLALAIGQAAWLKANAAVQLLGTGGQSTFTLYDELKHADWRPQHPFRIASIPYRLSPNVTAAYGFDVPDGVLNLFPWRYGHYWKNAVQSPNPELNAGVLSIAYQDEMDFLCCRSYAAARYLNLDALRLLNVEFIASVLPLSGDDLELVAGPGASRVPPRRDESLWAKLAGATDWLVRPTVNIYRLAGSAPRAYVVRSIAAWPTTGDDRAQYRQVIAAGLGGGISVEPTLMPRLQAAVQPGNVIEVMAVRDGYDVQVDLRAGGIVVVNTAFSPFWDGFADGRPVELVPVNGVQIAAIVGTAARHIQLRYNRPGVADILFHR